MKAISGMGQELPIDLDRVDVWIVMRSWGASHQARMWSNKSGHMLATARFIQSDSIEEIRALLKARGCTADESKRDLGKVIEIWVEPWKAE